MRLPHPTRDTFLVAQQCELSSDLKSWIRNAIVPILVKEWIQLKAELAKVSGGIAKLRERRAQLESELRNYAEAIASGVDVPAIVSAMRTRQAELDSITEKLLSAEPGSIDAQLDEIRQFVTSRVADLKTLFSGDTMLARTELLKHVQEIRMQPQSSDDEQYYEAEGEWNLLGGGYSENRQMKVVAGACNVPNLTVPF